ncbi:dihydrolipoyl dehydrogenase, apicoplast, putative [Plasmodium vinckei lentum]|uniref:Dihydrolipoyl dehydrogenase, apicoplast, putative n=1 Tax=Plasmodium vinckei lentum TaxID=138297 RepID=A0A6V7S0I3_PLAVN|nr:dihydrolipoyl dehydrogenase, apicoplast, putative [Plasmodium vinckei lentum]
MGIISKIKLHKLSAITLICVSFLFILNKHEGVKILQDTKSISALNTNWEMKRECNIAPFPCKKKKEKKKKFFIELQNYKIFCPTNGNIKYSEKIKSKLNTKSENNNTPKMEIFPNEYDVAILGCGVGGHAAAINAMERNLKVVMFAGDEQSLGGTCVNVGCIPSKSLLYATNKYRELKSMSKLCSYGIYSNAYIDKEKDEIKSTQLIADSICINTDKLKEYTQNVIKKLKSGITHGMKNTKFTKNSQSVQVVYDHGYIIDKHTIQSKKNKQIYKTKNIILATGSTPNVPKNIQVDQKTVFTSDQAVNLQGLKNYISIIGMGIIGLEFSDIYTALGSEVTFFEYSSEFLPFVDTDVAKYFENVFLKNKPINYFLNTEIKYVYPASINKPVVIGYSSRPKTDLASENYTTETDTEPVKELHVDSCLVATGRKPNTENIGLENLNAKMNKGFVSVDDQLRVQIEPIQKTDQGNANINQSIDTQAHDNIFCIGDANGKQMLAHTASHQALRVIDYIDKKENKKEIINSVENISNKPIIYKNIPSVCYTNPELAFVGVSEKEAKKLYPDSVDVEITYYKSNSKILCENNISLNTNKNNSYNKGSYNFNDNSNGMVKMIYNKNTKQLLGVFIVGNYASILIHEAVLAINHNLTIYDLAYMVHSHPTVSEVLDTAFKSASGIRTH